MTEPIGCEHGSVAGAVPLIVVRRWANLADAAAPTVHKQRIRVWSSCPEIQRGHVKLQIFRHRGENLVQGKLSVLS
jgi:hypothetical protein